jgi:5-methylcytosine-specific restriction endonuclease McrA
VRIRRKRKAKTLQQKLEDKLTKVFELYIRHRDNWTCITCGRQDIGNFSEIHAGHLISRKRNATLWDEENVFAQCRNCNCRHVWHPDYYNEVYIRKFGSDKYLELVRKSREVFKPKIAWLEEKVEHYEKELQNIISMI